MEQELDSVADSEPSEWVGREVRVHVHAYIRGVITDVRRDWGGKPEDAQNNLIFHSTTTEIEFTDDDTVSIGWFDLHQEEVIELEVSEYEICEGA